MFGRYAKNFSGIAVAAPLLLLLLAVVGTSAVDSWPASIKRCRMDDEPCIIQQANILFRLARNGIPERNVPSIDPMDLGTLRVNSGREGSSLQFNLLLTDTKMFNFVNASEIKSFKGFVKNPTKPMKLIFVITSSEVEVRAKYDVNGKVLILPIVSKGDLIISLRNMLGKTRVTVEPQKRSDGLTYLKITDYKTVMKLGSGHFNMTNLFEDNVALRDSTLKLLNDEWDAVSVDIRPKLIHALDRGFWTALQGLWDNIPYEEFFEK